MAENVDFLGFTFPFFYPSYKVRCGYEAEVFGVFGNDFDCGGSDSDGRTDAGDGDTWGWKL